MTDISIREEDVLHSHKIAAKPGDKYKERIKFWKNKAIDSKRVIMTENKTISEV